MRLPRCRQQERADSDVGLSIERRNNIVDDRGRVLVEVLHHAIEIRAPNTPPPQQLDARVYPRELRVLPPVPLILRVQSA